MSNHRSFIYPFSIDTEELCEEADEEMVFFEKTSHNIRVVVQPFWLEEQSCPEQHLFSWAYQIRIENHGCETVGILRGSWDVTDARGHKKYIEGECLLGEVPQLESGEVFEYTSSMSLNTPSGFMKGYYKITHMNSGKIFDIAIPEFSLDSPHQSSCLN
ncbi:MAG: Co2+/Mg2+ efflux protein ApaG [Commensalibacter sp.]|nr:Co2+/Mg2+ efflux protein ApaG [Commensalibacter sp.]